jgi:hypothetical protein
MGEAELAVLVMVLLVGLLIGLLLPWSSLLTSTGHPARRTLEEAAGRPVPGRRLEPGTGLAVAGALLALLASALLVAAIVPSLAEGIPGMEDVSGSAVVLSSAALVVILGYALPTWLGVHR